MQVPLNYKIYSFDIFDTLLLRPYMNPQELWSVLEEREHAIGFAKDRKKADAITYKLSSDEKRETTIEEAYSLIPKWQALMPKELELERSVLRANPETLKLWNDLGENGKKRVIVSDMYLPSDFIQSVLIEHSIKGWNGFYLSRDYNARKTTGELYKIMLHQQDVVSNDVLHIGDNDWSDVEMAKRIGIHTYHYKKIIDRFFSCCPFSRNIDGQLAGTLALGWHKYTYKHPQHTYWNRFGFIMGGVLGYLYVSWIVKKAKELGINRLLFIARDGYIWKKICNTLYPEIITEYIYAPRMVSVAVNGLVGNDPLALNDRKTLLTKYSSGNINDLESNYKQYVSQFSIDDKCAIVDGCSSAFSAQRLIEKTTEKNIWGFYLLSMASKNHTASLFSTNGYSMPFQNMSEFVFGSPEPPIMDVNLSGPFYNTKTSNEESFKMSVANQIADGAIACAKILQKENLNLNADKWIDYADIFMKTLTDEDKIHLAMAKNAGDIEQKNFNGIIWKPFKHFECWIEKWGRATFYIYLIFLNYKLRLYIGRGIKLKTFNMKPSLYKVIH